ncbi:MAG: type I DNA topoisomerase [Bacteroidales bacterium]|nr:type I DNA topoisomerase [Bacteroidales bacterium]MDT8373818.1 type I DNA topoisomerase [Bacteroidales bacterium]
MTENLVIVESPAKAKTIEKFLGKDFTVVSSFGHIRDLTKNNLGVEVEKGFNPVYEVPHDKKKVVSELRKLAGKAGKVWIASDEDREGEAIAWHLISVLGLDPSSTRRIVFHEITKEAITRAVESPRQVDMNLVNAQQARRILDRLVGFEISPVLWKKVQPSLSAGRVQSVAVRLLVDREREIISFVPDSAFRVTGTFEGTNSEGAEVILKAECPKKFRTEPEAESFLQQCSNSTFAVENIVVRPGTRSPAPPFTTSTLQQEAWRKLGFSVAQTMSVAQKLYEAGKITYMRTDSTNLSTLALNTAREVITGEFGAKYSRTRQFKTHSRGAQEAHEAIRPTYFDRKEATGSNNEKKLYELIWRRAIASQMADAEIEKTTVTIGMSSSPVTFTATGEVILFDGFLRVYTESFDSNAAEDEKTILPRVDRGMALVPATITALQRFTTPPPRYTEASLVKKLEELGIGRPSTYAPIISTIQSRGYVAREDRPGEKRTVTQFALVKGKITRSEKSEMAGKEKSKLFPKDIGMIVNDFLMANFPDIIDYNFTAGVEKEFDEIASGELEWDKMISQFYSPFHKSVDESLSTRARSTGARELGTDPETGLPVTVKMSRYGPVVQLGEASPDSKPRFANLRRDQLLETITLEEALALFALPRVIGTFEDEEMMVGIGKFGPYVKHAGKFYSLKKDVDDPYTITGERGTELIREKRKGDAQKLISEFGNIKVLNGRYGPYLAYDEANYRIPKGTDPQKLTREECLAIIEKGGRTKSARGGKKK